MSLISSIKRGADVRALVCDPLKANLPAGVVVAEGDLLDVDALRTAFSGVSTLFLLNAAVPDEFAQALVALNLAREAGIERFVYLSVSPSPVSCLTLAPGAIRRNVRGSNDAASSDRSSASGRIAASVTGDLPGVSRAIWTAPREAERMRRACGIRTP
jgi:hypothetical protein